MLDKQDRAALSTLAIITCGVCLGLLLAATVLGLAVRVFLTIGGI